ncbi:hypothetical protein QQS21_011961 [Conoideocrella luteorostrata]|uniref:FAD-binding FR-type domain-containing protein n=1 Tax=Conoideocrella luteorostrata TaxID=1105319 RepID=A0AAJ0FMU9_9HYPO|nr:hypothetical protein QQS21_011961 [Conoideocrella luteorostrata]
MVVWLHLDGRRVGHLSQRDMVSKRTKRDAETLAPSHEFFGIIAMRLDREASNWRSGSGLESCTKDAERQTRSVPNLLNFQFQDSSCKKAISSRTTPSVTHWKFTVLCHKVFGYHVSIPFVLDNHVADLVRFLVFLGLNILFGINNNEFTTDYKLYGWLTIANGGLALLLAPRANLFSILLKIPSSVLLFYHRLIGMATVAHGTAHFAFNIMHYIQTDQIETSFSNARIRIGLMAWLCLAIILITSLPVIRRKGFEIFYYAHFLFFIFMVGALIHTTNGPEFLLPGFSLWVVDRIVRLYHGLRSIEVQNIVHYQGRVTKFTVKGVRVIRPGQVVWVQLRGVSFLNWHPFTAICPPGGDENVAMFAIRGLGSYTKAVQHVDADQRNGDNASAVGGPQTSPRSVSVRLSGPYGVGRLDWHAFPVVALVAGGIGITPGIGIMSSIISARNSSSAPSNVMDIHLIWIVKEIHHATWFADELDQLRDLVSQPGSTVRLSISLYYTGTGDAEEKTQDGQVSDTVTSSWSVKMGRPNFAHWFQELSGQHPGCDVAVNLCGPRVMVKQARNAAVCASSSTCLFHIEDELFER